MGNSRLRPELGLLFVALPLVAAAWLGCSSDDPAPTAEENVTGDASTPETEAGPPGTTGRDCTGDTQGDGLPRHLECTGLYANFATKALADGVRAYRPAAELWSDGSDKSRWILLPAGTTIDIANFDDWKLPVGTKVWKEFRLDGKRIETRLFFKKGEADWSKTVYRYDEGETDAVRLEAGAMVTRPDGTTYEIPNTTQCSVCHEGRLEPMLGFDAVSLGLAGAEGLTLATLAAEQRFATAPPATSLAIPDDGTQKAAPAMAWLNINCGACHAKNGSALFRPLRARILAAELLADGGVANGNELELWKTMVGKPSNRTDDAGAPLDFVEGSDPARSAAFDLASRRAVPPAFPSPTTQMPPLLSRTTDPNGLAAVEAWIKALPANAGE